MTLDRSKIPLTRHAIADLVPLQRGLRSATVEEKRKLIRSGEPVDAPLIFEASGILYVADGHHTIEAAHLEGHTHIKGRVLRLGRLKMAKRLVPTTIDAVADPFRRECRVQERRLARKIAKILADLGAEVAREVGETWEEPSAEKLAKAIPPDDERRLARDLERMIEESILAIEALLEESIAAVAADAGEIVLAELMPDTYDSLVNQVFGRARDYAKRRAGELIGRNARGTGELAETTRKRIRANITRGIEENVGRRAIEEMLRDDFGFSEARAELIAGTEIANANSEGSHQGLMQAQEAGLRVEHSWICEEDACEICLENEAAGWIPADEPFPSGHLRPVAHPNCRCAEGGRVVEPVVKSHLSSVLGMSEGPSHQHPGDGKEKCHHDCQAA